VSDEARRAELATLIETGWTNTPFSRCSYCSKDWNGGIGHEHSQGEMDPDPPYGFVLVHEDKGGTIKSDAGKAADAVLAYVTDAVVQAVEEAQLPPVRKLITDLEKQIAEVDTINKLSAKVTEQDEEIARLKRNLAYHETRLPESRKASNEVVRRLGFLPAEEIVWANKEHNGRALQDVWRDAGCRRDPAEILPAIIDALTQEGITAWPGDATSIVEQIVRVQYGRAEALRGEPQDDGKMPCSFCGKVVDPEGHRWECPRREPTPSP